MSCAFDSSSLMYLGKINLLEKIKFISNKNFIPKKVYEEVIIEGTEKKEPEIKIPADPEGRGIFNPPTGNDGRGRASGYYTQL